MLDHATNDTFEEKVLKNDKLTVVDFWASWCAPCVRFKPIFEETAAEITDVDFIKVDVQANQQIAGQIGIMSIPTVSFFKGGKEVGRFTGAVSKTKFKELIEEEK